jgi:hypothetical protein
MKDMGAPAGDCSIENVTKVPAKKSTLRKPSSITAMGFKPFCEMIRLPGPGAHPFGGNVEKMRSLSR